MAEDGLLAGVPGAVSQRRLRVGLPRRGWVSITLVLIPILVLAPLVGFYLYLTAPIRAGAIARGVQAGGIDLSGLTPPQAEDRLRQALPDLSSRAIMASAAGFPLRTTAAHLGATWNLHPALQDSLSVGRGGGLWENFQSLLVSLRQGRHFPVPISIHRDKLIAAIRPLAWQVVQRARNAGIHFTDPDADDSPIQVIPSRPGRRLDLAGSSRQLADAITGSGIQSGAITVELPVQLTRPPITEDTLRLIDGKVAEYTTIYHPWQVDRSHNLWLASQAINGAILMPGQVFSYNKRVGQRLISRGYRAAPIFVKGEVKDDTGGGVCQVATTVYNAALLSNCRIVERNSHSMHTSYSTPGRDATVAWDALDLKFRNTRDSPIVLTTEMGGGSLTVRVWGRVHPGEHVRVFTRDLPHGVVAYRQVISPDGRSQVHVLSEDPYQKKPVE